MVFISVFHSYKYARKNDFFNIKPLTSSCHIQHITLHKNFVFLAVTNLKFKNYTNFYKFLFYQEMYTKSWANSRISRYKLCHMGTAQQKRLIYIFCNRKRPQTTTNDHKQPANDHKRLPLHIKPKIWHFVSSSRTW